MNEEPRSELPATALIDTHNERSRCRRRWDALPEAVKDLVSMGRIGDEPEVVLDTSGVRHPVWRGCLTGGLITVLALAWHRAPQCRALGLPWRPTP